MLPSTNLPQSSALQGQVLRRLQLYTTNTYTYTLHYLPKCYPLVAVKINQAFHFPFLHHQPHPHRQFGTISCSFNVNILAGIGNDLFCGIAETNSTPLQSVESLELEPCCTSFLRLLPLCSNMFKSCLLHPLAVTVAL